MAFGFGIKQEEPSALDDSRTSIPKRFESRGLYWNFRSAIIRSGFLSRGHFKSLIKIGNEMKLFDDNNVLTMTEREGFSRMRFNRYGFVYGVIYEKS